MKPIGEATLAALCEQHGIRRADLEYFAGGREDSDGILYRYPANGGKRLLKIVSKEAADRDAANGVVRRVEFAGFLNENGISIAGPLRMRDGALYKSTADGDTLYLSYEMDVAAGHNPEMAELTDAVASTWGRLIGKTHRLVKSFPLSADEAAPNYRGETAFFTDWCHHETVKAAWKRMADYVGSLPFGKDDGGFIHNDDHVRNILLDGTEITLIDFDCACRQFYIQDIMTAGQGLLFEDAGGMMAPFRDAERLRRFYHAFIDGYERENRLDAAWYARLPDFIQYRRLLLFTCMQDWLATQPSLQDSFLRVIEAPPQFSL